MSAAYICAFLKYSLKTLKEAPGLHFPAVLDLIFLFCVPMPHSKISLMFPFFFENTHNKIVNKNENF